ncbi:hypothetical protein [Pimelobacter sp. 30-1]|uniref:hypothetical protein n=1 Tax=Pimelobacter sp. 30-1 TaxID=2004991 RepID=UPI001C0453E7|nr:hypothetical protein [Pimelobacter sp. 30-1]MBU2695348.1 hypothetical protein [Pimelobacter sp. 30-1]
MTDQARQAELAPVVEAAQRVAGVIAARGRGDAEGARDLLRTFADERELAGGALLVAELSLGLLRSETGESLDECVRALCVEMESSLR